MGRPFLASKNLSEGQMNMLALKVMPLPSKNPKKSKKNCVRKVWLRCDRGSEYKPAEYNKRQSFTRQIECPFALITIRDVKTKIWILNVNNPSHNHDSFLGESHPIYRRTALTENFQKSIVSQTRINASINQILSAIRIDKNDENPLIKPSNIYNIRANHKRKELKPFSSV